MESKAIENIVDNAAEQLAFKIDTYILACLKPKPKWLPVSHMLWMKICGKFIVIKQLHK